MNKFEKPIIINESALFVITYWWEQKLTIKINTQNDLGWNAYCQKY